MEMICRKFQIHSACHMIIKWIVRNVFETDNVMDCIKIILEKGEIQLTAAERKEMVDKKRNEIGKG